MEVEPQEQQHRKYYYDKKQGLHVALKKRKCINCGEEFNSFGDARMCEACKRVLKSKKINFDMVG